MVLRCGYSLCISGCGQAQGQGQALHHHGFCVWTCNAHEEVLAQCFKELRELRQGVVHRLLPRGLLLHAAWRIMSLCTSTTCAVMARLLGCLFGYMEDPQRQVYTLQQMCQRVLRCS
jgi:hypothetical protein